MQKKYKYPLIVMCFVYVFIFLENIVDTESISRKDGLIFMY